MALDFTILKKFGTTDRRLKEILTARPLPKKDMRKMKKEEREKWKDKIAANERDMEILDRWKEEFQSRINEGVNFSLKNHRIWSAIDLAWDSNPINKITIPLMEYAQGRISVTKAANALSGLNCSDQFVQKDESGTVTGIDLPKFREVTFNLIRSFVTRRLAAQTNKYSNLWPYYKYDARGTSQVAKLRAEALSQRVDIMTDQFGYRHHDPQVMRHMLLYSRSIDFVRSRWEEYKQWDKVDRGEVFDNPDDFDQEAKVIKEGISFVNPHPSRVFYDNAHPLSTLNTDTGVEWVGFWDVYRFKDVKHNPQFFNTDTISFGETLWDVYVTYKDFFNQYLDTITNPKTDRVALDYARLNDRSNNVGLYSERTGDASVLLTNYFKKLNPKAEGIGNYPYDLWVRFVIAADDTPVYAEILPSTPGAYAGFNEDDNRLVNISFAHELMSYQDMMTNLITTMQHEIQRELLSVININKDLLEDPQIASIRKQLQGHNFWADPIVVESSFAKLDNIGIKVDDVISIVQGKQSQALTHIFEAMGRLLGMAERLVSMSPAEQGQPNPREVSATEVLQIESTTSSVTNYLSDAIDEFRDAKKRIIYESLMSMGSEQEIQLPITKRFSRETVERAGFKVVEESDMETANTPLRDQFTVYGTKEALEYDYVFTTRDGSERPINTNSANTLVQLLNVVFSDPTGLVLQRLGKHRLFLIFNEIFRMSGAGVDLLLELDEGEDDSFGNDEVQQLIGAVNELAGTTKTNTAELIDQGERLLKQEQLTEKQSEGLKSILAALKTETAQVA